MLDWEVFVWGGEGERKLVFDWEVFVWFVFLGATRFFLSFVFFFFLAQFWSFAFLDVIGFSLHKFWLFIFSENNFGFLNFCAVFLINKVPVHIYFLIKK